jgi:uncharacterized protein YdcH (DUF465 family)
MTKAKIKQRVKPCPVPSDLCNDVCIYGTPCIRPRLWKTAYEQGKKDTIDTIASQTDGDFAIVRKDERLKAYEDVLKEIKRVEENEKRTITLSEWFYFKKAIVEIKDRIEQRIKEMKK